MHKIMVAGSPAVETGNGIFEFINLANGNSVACNPLGEITSVDLEFLLRSICIHELPQQDQAEIEDQIEALAPALVELRDAGHVDLNMSVIASYATLDGFIQLADDERLTDLSRCRCRAIRDRLIVFGVKQLLGHN